MKLNISNRNIEVVDYDSHWKIIFETEKTALAKAIGSNAVKIDHIGSTLVIGLAAKPIVDILIEVSNLEALDAINKNIIALGYTSEGENGISGRRYFHKSGVQPSLHVHVFQSNDSHLHRHRAFKEYLITHPVVASEYASIKKAAALKSNNDINVYMALKNDFIQKHEKLALKSFGNEKINWNR